MSFDDWTHEGKSTVSSPPSSPPTPALLLLNPSHRPVLAGDRRPLVPNLPGLGCLLLFFLPFFAVGIYMPFSCGRSWMIEQKIKANPVRVTAQVLGTRTASGDDSDTYYVKYRYLGHEREAAVSPAEQTRAGQSGTIDVVYCQSQPELSRAVKERRTSLGFVILWSVIWDGALLLLTLSGVFSLLRTGRLIARGQLVGGIVTGARSRLDSDDDLVLTLDYRFQSPAGQPVDAQLSVIRNEYKKQELPAAGTPVAVLYADPGTHQVL